MTNILDKIGLTGSIKPKLIALFLLVSIIPIVIVSNLAFEYGSTSTEEQVMTHLTSVADFKINEIEFWLEDMQNDAELLSNNLRFVDFLIAHKENTVNISELENHTLNLFEITRNTYPYMHLSLIDNSGEVLISTDHEDVGTIITAKYATTPFITREVYIQDIFKTADDNFSMIFAAPIFSIDSETHEKEKEVIGILIIETDMATSLYPIIEDLQHMGETGETILVRREGDKVVFISELNKLNESALYLTIPITSTIALPAIRSSKGEEGIMIAEDYMGEEVLSAYRHIDVLNWGLITKIDENEAFAGVNDLKNKITTISIFLIFIVFGMAIWISTSITKPIMHLEKITKKVAQGDYSDYPVMDSNDEIGSLSNSFVKMEQELSTARRKLENYNKDLEDTVDERTQELEEKTQELQGSEHRLIRAQEVAHVGDWVLNTETKKSIWSTELYRIYGFEPADEIELKTMIAGIHPDDRDYVNETLAGWIENGEGEPSEYRIVRPDGSIRYVYSPAEFICDSTGKVVQMYGTVLDITERKQTEEKLKEYAESLEHSNELKVLFADIMRHDLLNPAGIIQGYTEILFDMEDDEKKIDFLKRIEKNNKKLIKLIESTARFAKLESVEELEFGEEDIASMFKIVVDNLTPKIEDKHITLEFKADDTYSANVSPMIEEVFVNLLSNAIKYSPEKSKIIVDIIDAGENWKVTVTDFGEGVSDEHKTMLFDRFQRVNKVAVKGSGLGLAIVKRIIELHEGEVGVEDNPAGVGSVFWVTVGKA